jgi:pSer/pThr/pTyr-binding forkhead associated (FHA) protein
MTSSDHSGRKNGKSPRKVRELEQGAAVLRVLRGFYEGLEVPMDRGRIVIGRGREADLTVAEPTISRQHAAIEWDGGGYVLQDLGSTNGTRVNGRRATRARLCDGDEIELGRLQLRLQAAMEPARG